MPAKKATKAVKAVKRTPPPVPSVSVAGEPAGRWAQILAETREAGLAIEPFEVTDDLVLFPPTVRRTQDLDAAYAGYMAGQAALVNAVTTGATQDEVEKIRDAIYHAETAYNEALFGGADKYAAVCAYFDDRPNWEKQAFEDAVKQEFLRLPPDGRCKVCGTVVDPKGPTTENASSTTSTTTGTISRETSPTTSTEQTPETGPAA